MTWYAHEIILRATPGALALVHDSPWLMPFAYHVRSLEEHAWHAPEHRHGLPPEGLVFVRPVCDTNSHGAQWHESPTFDWSTLPGNSDVGLPLDPSIQEALAAYLQGEAAPPTSLRETLASWASSLQQPVMYYGCGMWGGSIDYEYCLVHQPAESLFVTASDFPFERSGSQDALCAGLQRLGLSLPTPYFAPHTREFPWASNKLSEAT